MSASNRDRPETPLRGAVVACALGALVFTGGCNLFGLFGDDSGGSESKPTSGAKSEGQSDSDAGPAAGGAQAGEGEGSDSEDTGTSPQPAMAGESVDAGGGPKRNPFAPQVEVEEEDEEKPSETGQKKLGPLEKHPLESYRLVGIISEVAVPKAMFIAPDGKGHLLRESETLGRQGGVIKDIRSNTVEIEVPRKGQKPKTISLELRSRKIEAGGGSELSPEERETLKQLMESEEGRKAVRESFEKAAPAANAAEGEQGDGEGAQNQETRGTLPGGDSPE